MNDTRPVPLPAPLPTGSLMRLWGSAILAGALTVPAVLALFGALTEIEAFPALIAVSSGLMAFGGVFFLGVNLLGVRLEVRVRDETRISGANVDQITHVTETGDAETDRWLARYVFARNLFGSLIVPLAIFLGLIWFG